MHPVINVVVGASFDAVPLNIGFRSGRGQQKAVRSKACAKWESGTARVIKVTLVVRRRSHRRMSRWYVKISYVSEDSNGDVRMRIVFW